MSNARTAGVAVVFLVAGLMAVSAVPGYADGDKGMAMLRAGYASLKAKKYDAAVKTFSEALTSGNLKSDETAKALYYRGVAYRKARKPAQAISDFSRALWLKSGLSPTEIKDAEAQRTAAYKEAGASPVVAGAPAAPAVASVKPRASSATKTAAAPRGWQTATRPTKSGGSSGGGQGTSASNPITNFFSNLFGGTTQSSASTGPTGGSHSPSTTGSVPAVSEWSSQTKSQPARVNRTKRTAHARKGHLTVQVAAMRNKSEADALVRKLGTRHGALLKGRNAAVVPKAYGNMGTLYQVRVGPFATASATRPFCRKMQSDGLDCLVQKN